MDIAAMVDMAIDTTTYAFVSTTLRCHAKSIQS